MQRVLGEESHSQGGRRGLALICGRGGSGTRSSLAMAGVRQSVLLRVLLLMLMLLRFVELWLAGGGGGKPAAVHCVPTRRLGRRR